ncbi:MAG: N-acetylneuraminate synthase [Magnetococcales bacterium]|nr:N-acetylneuraminate synthase [Magnetococcales bacterium]
MIAEAGVNHNGSLDRALRLVDAAVLAGVDAVKFQTFKADRMVTRGAAKANYQQSATDPHESQWEMIRRLELSETDHERLLSHCRESGIQFLSSPFDLESLQFLVERLGVDLVKIPSGEITNAPLLLQAGASQRAILLSTGMATLGEIELALGALAFGASQSHSDNLAIPSIETFEMACRSPDGRRMLEQKVTLLHCTTEYPAPYGEVNLRAMDTLRAAFALPVGFSDHTPGIAVAIAAAARGAAVIEKHFTLDRHLPGPDHQSSLEPVELADMVRSVHAVVRALGDGIKVPMPSELGNRDVARKSLTAACDILADELFSTENLTIKRPGTGISPMHYWQWLGRRAGRNYHRDQVIE